MVQEQQIINEIIERLCTACNGTGILEGCCKSYICDYCKGTGIMQLFKENGEVFVVL